MEVRTDRLGILVDQLASSCEFAQARLDGISNEEFLWEPAPGSWSVRPRGSARTSDAYGPGEWVMDFVVKNPLGRGPVTTIAWRLGHLASMFAGRWEWTFGDRATAPELLVDFTPIARRAVDGLWPLVDRWRADLDTLTEEQLDVPGFGQYPRGLDPQLPFVAIVWWMNREFIHHIAEIALLRDLWQARSARQELEEAIGRGW
jgi:hypothetical protein